jgi:aspartyl-tRNA(Asn)/glutamyl-tRNA(Gln) amidotransferase subunit C
MPFTEKDVRYVADLAHLELTEEEVQKYLPQIESILEYVQKLNELDTSAIEPMAQVTYPGSQNAALRHDLAQPNFSQDQALANAPEPGAGCFKVPRVIEREE